jgi:hypothetical protein
MKLHRTYNIIINDIIYFTSTNYNRIVDEFTKIRRMEPKAYIQTCYA